MSNKEAVKWLIGLLANYKKTIFFIICCLLVCTGLNLCMPLISKNIMDQGFIGGNKSLLLKLVIISVILYVVNSMIDMIKEKKRLDIAAQLEYSLTEKAFTHLLKLKADYFWRTNYTEILNNINTDIGNIVSITESNMFFIVTQLFSISGGLLGLFIIDYKLTILVLLFIPFKYFIMKYFAKIRKKLVDEFIEENQTYAKWFGDTIGGIQEIKYFNIRKYKQNEFELKQKRVIEKKKK